MIRTFRTLAAALLLAACDSTEPVFELPSEGVHPGMIQYNGLFLVEVPATATVGTPVRLEVETVTRQSRFERTRVSLEGRVLVVEPLDEYLPPGPSLSAMTLNDHSFEYVFEEAGDYQVLAPGRSDPGWRPVEVRYDIRVTNESGRTAQSSSQAYGRSQI